VVKRDRARWEWATALIPPRVSGALKYLWFWNHLSPAALFLASFLLLISIGTAGLMLIPGLHAKEPLGFVDSLFTMTSAVCVTGLTVADTATQFTFAGKAWILLFIQLGGLGLITLGTLLIGALGNRLSLRSEMLTMMPTRQGDRPEVWQIALNVTRFSLVVEGVGALVLFLVWLPRMPADEALGHAVFHSVSAYCNAGFSTFSDNLMSFTDSPLTLLVISLLIIIGGLGYLTFEELLRWRRTARAKRLGIRIMVRGTHRLSSHTWAALTTTAALLGAGWVLFALFEWNESLAGLSVLDKIVNALFLSVTPRTAGFNSIDYGLVGNDTASLTMMLMLIGGSPGSTAGGLKTTTLAVLVALGLSRMRGKRHVELKHRSIPEGTIERAVGIVLLAILVLAIAFFVVSAIQAAGATPAESRQAFLPTLFEVISAFATVGLSMSFTPELEAPAKLVIASLMYIGRVGLLSFFTAVTLRRARGAVTLRAAQEDVIVG
jgi:trk system potassium uptake protein TrkH